MPYIVGVILSILLIIAIVFAVLTVGRKPQKYHAAESTDTQRHFGFPKKGPFPTSAEGKGFGRALEDIDTD
jgi:hypothetical protein